MSDWGTPWGNARRAYRAVNHKTGCTIANTTQAATIANLLQRWWDTGTASFLDDLVIYLDDEGLPILPMVAHELAQAAQKRRGDRPSKAEREGIKDHAFVTMANLILAGSTLQEAAGKAATWTERTPHSMKASSLEREYSSVWRRGKPSLEDELRNFMRDHPDPKAADEWLVLRGVLPEPSADRRGERR